MGVTLEGVPRIGKEPMVVLSDALERLPDLTYVHKKRALYDFEGMVGL